MQPRDRNHQGPGRRLAGTMSDSTTAGATPRPPGRVHPAGPPLGAPPRSRPAGPGPGSALFADISGFTPLTEALVKELGPQRGAEELTANIGRVFHAVIGELDAYDGNVIYFAGDAITCWIDGDDGTRACAAATGMQEAIARTGLIVTPGGAEVRLAMKVAVAVGDARRFVVGDPDIQLIDVLAGRLMDDLAEAEHHAEKGEIVLDPSAVAALGGAVALGDLRTDEISGRTCAVLRGLLVDVEPEPGHQPAPLPEDLVRPWLLPAVYERLRTGRGEFLAELRPAIPVFLRFGGIDYDHDDDAIEKLDDFVRAAQRIMSGLGGNVLQLTLGDKGAYLYGVFGSPLAHEDDAARAAAAALELRDLEKTTAAREIQVGMSQGRLRSGTYGHEMRRTFVCLGDAVNLAARLMSAAPRERIYVSGPVREAAGEAFIWERLPDLKVKGKADPVEVWSLDGSLERASRRKTRFELGLVGRQRELGLLEARMAEARGGAGPGRRHRGRGRHGQVPARRRVRATRRRRGQLVAFGECQAFGTKTPYFVWREIWRRLFGLDDDDAAERAGRRARAPPGGRSTPRSSPRAPLLSDVVGLSIPDSDLTRSFDAKLRKSSLEDLLAACLRARAREGPFVAVLEDCHWIDELSRDLLEVLVRAATALPVLFVLAYRPASEPGGGSRRGAAPGVLGAGARPDGAGRGRRACPVEDGAARRRRLPRCPHALVELIAARSDGNPFYVEELLNYLVAQGVDTSDPGAIARHPSAREPPHARPEPHRRGRRGAPADDEGRERRGPRVPGADAPRRLRRAGITRGSAGPPRLPAHAGPGGARPGGRTGLDVQARRHPGGRVREPSLRAAGACSTSASGDYIERTEADDIDRVVPLLEHHYWRSDREDKKREYLRQGRRGGAGVVREPRRDRLLRPPDPAARRRRAGGGDAQGTPRSCTSSARPTGPRRSWRTREHSPSTSTTRRRSRAATTPSPSPPAGSAGSTRPPRSWRLPARGSPQYTTGSASRTSTTLPERSRTSVATRRRHAPATSGAWRCARSSETAPASRSW